MIDRVMCWEIKLCHAMDILFSIFWLSGISLICSWTWSWVLPGNPVISLAVDLCALVVIVSLLLLTSLYLIVELIEVSIWLKRRAWRRI